MGTAINYTDTDTSSAYLRQTGPYSHCSRTPYLPGVASVSPTLLLQPPLLSFSSPQPVNTGWPGPSWTSTCSPSSLYSFGAIAQLLHTDMLLCLMRCWNTLIQVSRELLSNALVPSPSHHSGPTLGPSQTEGASGVSLPQHTWAGELCGIE